MAQQYIFLEQTGLSALNVLNSNFTELYGAITIPIKVQNQSASFFTNIPANSFIPFIFITALSGNPSVNIGLTPDGGEILPTYPVSPYLPVQAQQYFPTDGDLYFTITGGEVNIRIDVIYNYN